ncbi:MAG: hypothetical protein BGO43_06860 [Gammaproteobacteria bacterium 39-13]|nr:hypothetical protein [Gammaproteobacteria bacterium]OJV90556.1 MAG: hypothetical protein BGO43_06860 [Gammaproteobacteria bacterium 39-13]
MLTSSPLLTKKTRKQQSTSKKKIGYSAVQYALSGKAAFSPRWQRELDRKIDETLFFKPEDPLTEFVLPTASFGNQIKIGLDDTQYFETQGHQIPFIYHYTNMEGLAGILSSGKIFYSEHSSFSQEMVSADKKKFKTLNAKAKEVYSKTQTQGSLFNASAQLQDLNQATQKMGLMSVFSRYPVGTYASTIAPEFTLTEEYDSAYTPQADLEDIGLPQNGQLGYKDDSYGITLKQLSSYSHGVTGRFKDFTCFVLLAIDGLWGAPIKAAKCNEQRREAISYVLHQKNPLFYKFAAQHRCSLSIKGRLIGYGAYETGTGRKYYLSCLPVGGQAHQQRYEPLTSIMQRSVPITFYQREIFNKKKQVMDKLAKRVATKRKIHLMILLDKLDKVIETKHLYNPVMKSDVMTLFSRWLGPILYFGKSEKYFLAIRQLIRQCKMQISKMNVEQADNFRIKLGFTILGMGPYEDIEKLSKSFDIPLLKTLLALNMSKLKRKKVISSSSGAMTKQLLFSMPSFKKKKIARDEDLEKEPIESVRIEAGAPPIKSGIR